MINLVANPAPMFFDIDGSALNGGTVYVGIPNVDPVNNPISVYQDPALSIPMQQPLKVAEGVVFLNGSPRQVFTSASQFSMAIFNSRGVMVASYPAVSAVAQLPPTGGTLDKIYKASSGDFVPGTTTQLTLPADPGTVSNMIITFDGLTQHDDQVLTLAYPTLTFTAPIPLGVQEIQIKIGATTSGSIAPPGSVTDASVASDAGIQSSKLAFLQAGAGAVSRTVQSKLRQWVDVIDFGADPTGVTDASSAVASAIASLPSGGGDVWFPPGTYLLSSFPDLTNKVGIRIYGSGGMSAGAGRATEILINGTGSTPFINAPGSTGFVCDDIQFIVKNAGFTGFIISYGSSPANAAFGKVRGCSFFGGATARYVSKGINLDKTIEAEIDSCQFGTLLFAIAGSSSGSFSNVIRIANCQFVDTAQIPIQGGGQAWRILTSTFEGYNNGTPGNVLAGAVANFPVNPFNGLEFAGNWLGDVLTNGGTWLNLSGGGIDIHGGNFFGGSSGSNAIGLTSVDSANIEGNTFNTFAAAISFVSGNSPNIWVGPNEWQSVTNRFGSVAGWPGYAGPVLYEPLSNSKMQVRGSASVTAGTPTPITFPFSFSSIETAPCGYTSAPGSNTPPWAIKNGSGLTLNIGGSGTCSVDFHAIVVLPN